jgi:MoxR-like ATPase
MRRQARVNERPGASQDQAYQWASPDVIGRSLTDAGYLADERICSVVYLGDRLGKPVLVEGPAGTGKTELAKSVAAAAGRRLIRLQCYEGLDEAKALYEWNYSKQLLRIQAERTGTDRETADWTDLQADIFSQEFLLTRPLLAAIRAPDPVVLLIDEVDRIDVETEALLLEVLSDYQISIPELGTVTSTQTPLVYLTSNNSRELSEALKRRCLYLYLDYPAPEREQAIVLRRVPDLSVALADQITRVVGSLRRLELKKRPSVSETIDWARTLSLLGVEEISTDLIIDTLHVLLKHQPDIEKAAVEFSRTR